jgi:Skp family chaperone for outer membrane proteins
VAAAAPRGTAFVGKEGVAISSPQATAVAGPTRDEIQQKNKKQNKRRQ